MRQLEGIILDRAEVIGYPVLLKRDCLRDVVFVRRESPFAQRRRLDEAHIPHIERLQGFSGEMDHIGTVGIEAIDNVVANHCLQMVGSEATLHPGVRDDVLQK